VLLAQRSAALCQDVTIDLDTTDVEVGVVKRAGTVQQHGVRIARERAPAGAPRGLALAGSPLARGTTDGVGAPGGGGAERGRVVFGHVQVQLPGIGGGQAARGKRARPA
jgi:hypothetical protein